MTEVTLPSGAVLGIALAPFPEAKELYQAVLEELRLVSVKDETEIDIGLFKDLFCVGFSSKKIEAATEKISKRCLYNGERIDPKTTWEPVEARADYLKACLEIAKETISPFVRSLSAEFSLVRELVRKDQATRQPTTS